MCERTIRQCVICRKCSGAPYKAPDPPPLPKLRVQQSDPFTTTGVDFTGALYVRGIEGENKVYICLFTCAVTRAVHLEVVTDLTEQSFIQAFRRFVNRKSLPHTMISDNASTYLAAADELKNLFQSTSLKETLGRQGVEWKFIPKRAPWFGGFWERLIGLTKNALKKVLGRSFVSLTSLQTITTEIEAFLNNRPLTYVSSESDDPNPLTPAHLLYGRTIITLPRISVEEGEIDDPDYGNTSRPELTRRLKLQSQLLKHFWSRWRHDYLTSLREFHKVTGNNSQQVSVGDVVVVHSEGPRLSWRLAVVKQLIKGNDGMIRAAHIRTSSGETSRPITKLYPLEISAKEQQALTTEKIARCSTDPKSRPRSTRGAANRARELISEWAKILRPPGVSRNLSNYNYSIVFSVYLEELYLGN